MSAGVASVDPSSITMISDGGNVWSRTERTAAGRRSSRLWVGITTDTEKRFDVIARYRMKTPVPGRREAVPRRVPREAVPRKAVPREVRY